MLSLNNSIMLYSKVDDITCLGGDVPVFDWCLAIDLPYESTLFCYDAILVIQFSKLLDVRYYNNHSLHMLEQIKCKAYSALAPRLRRLIKSLVDTKLDGFLLST